MMGETVLKVENLSKVYRLGEVGTGTISHDLNRWWAKVRGKEDPYAQVGQVNDQNQAAQTDYVNALEQVDFEVQKGEVLGIIGKNGAGKSTLLKLISKITAPSAGSIKAKGRIASLLEVGTGMHPEMTARENIYLNGAILGMTKKEIAAKFDEIIEFAGCRMFIDTPVKRFSSGMKVRLGFAVAAHMEPEILVVDEVLAVGDAEFQKKCIGKMKDVAGEGRTVLFVSHNMSSVRNLCTKSILIDKGSSVFIGDTEETIQKYLSLNVDFSSISEVYRCTDSSMKDNQNYVKKAYVDLPKDITSVEYSNDIIFIFEINYPEKNRDIFMGVIIEDTNGNFVTVTSTDEVEKDPIMNIDLKERHFTIKMIYPGKILKPGKYFLTFSFREKTHIYHKKEKAISFVVEDMTTYKGMKNRYRKNSLISPEISWH